MMGGFKEKKKKNQSTNIIVCGLHFKANKVKKTNKIILISFTWELGTLGDASKSMAAMCACIIFIFFFVLILIGNDI